MKRRFSAVAMVLIMMISLIPCNLSVQAATTTETQLTVESKTASPGSTVTVNVSIKNNPGILGAELKLDYSADLTLVEAKCGEMMSGLTFTRPGKYVSGCKFIWDGQSVDLSDVMDGDMLSLTFTVSEYVANEEELNVNITCENMIDADMNSIETSVTNGVVKIGNTMLGDVNGDSKINTTDIILTRRYLAGGYDVEINQAAADVNGDSKVNTTDIILIRRYLAGGYDVEFAKDHKHKMNHVEKVEANCTDKGNIEYWKCQDCGKYYTDVNGLNEITLQDTVIEAKGHAPVVDAAVAPTVDKTGLTEGSHCKICNVVLVKQEIVDKLPESNKESYAITYNIYEDDSYLKSINIVNKNPAYYYSEDGLRLTNLKVDGYIFEGWYDSEGSNAELIKQIPAGTKGEIELYAHWTPRTYTVTFDSPLVPMNSITYTVNKGATLTDPSWFGYTFMGWSDEKGNVVTKIPKGTAEDITLSANWMSKRNQTRAIRNLSDPIIYEDKDQGQYLFVYEIGQIENVPLYTIKNFGNVSGLTVSETITSSSSVNEATANSIVNTIANATTKTSSWTLSKDWNDSLTEITSHTDESGQTHVDSTEKVKGTDKVNVTGSSKGGNSGTVNYTSDSLASKTNAKIGAGVSEGIAKISAEYSVENSDTHKEDNTKSATKTWDKNKSTEKSKNASTNKKTSNEISSKISDTYGYNKTHSEGGSESLATSDSQTSSESNEYASSLTYSTQETQTVSKTYSNANAPEGYYRMVCAGTVHMFGVVGYDIASSQYYVYSFGVQDDNTYDFIDYSKNTPEFNDYEIGVLPFEIPFFVNQYIDEQIRESEGLVVDKSSGIITGYTGSGKDVIIPDYITMDSVNGEPEVVKIVGVDKRAFAGNTDITSVKFGKYVTELPDSVFEGCTSLKSVEAPAVTKIGAKAFYGCTSLEDYTISSKVTSIGVAAFMDVSKINVTPANAELVQVICNSGAKDIVLNIADVASEMTNMALAIPEGTQYVELNGGKNTFNNLSISSKAETTVINKMNMVSDKGVPFTTSSSNVKVSSSSLEAPSWNIICSADNTTLTLDGTVTMTSAGAGAILTKNITLKQLLANSKAKLNVNGNVYVCDNISDNGLLSVKDGETIIINEDSFKALMQDSIEWVLESEMPSGAHVLAEKWTYDQITTTTSNKNVLDGYSLYDSSYVWSNYGAWSGWQNSAVAASDSRQVETQNIPATYRTQYLYSRYGSNSNGGGTIGPCKGTWSGVYCQYYVDTGWLDSPKPVSGSQQSVQMGGTFYMYDNNHWFNEQTRQVIVTNAYTQYRYRDRSKVYTYYFKKTESKESDTEVKESNEITNVQKWVKYVVE